MSNQPTFSRRRFLQGLGLGAAAITVGAPAPQASALGPVLGTVLDYAAGVPSGAAVKAAGHLGAVRYVSGRRPGAEWMLGKPVLKREADDFAASGLAIASVYQFGKGDTADWKGPATWHAHEAARYHFAAGGPTGRPIYAAIDDNPTRAQYVNQIRPYLTEFKQIMESQGLRLGVYGNYNVIDWASADGLGEFFWQHDWGSLGRIHPRTTIHQKAGYQRTVGGVLCDVNNVYAHDWGQWNASGAGGAGGTVPGTAVGSLDALAELLRNLSSLSAAMPK